MYETELKNIYETDLNLKIYETELNFSIYEMVACLVLIALIIFHFKGRKWDK